MQEVLSANVNSEQAFCVDYQCTDNAYDEMCFDSNKTRPHWEYLLRSLKILGRTALEHRQQEALHLLRDNGVTYNVHGDPLGRDRPWQLDLIPLLIASEEWTSIERGLIQRADLMNLILADIYGPQETLRKGLLPIELIATHPGFLRPCHGLTMSGRHRLPLYAVDLVRAPNGQFWALADRTQSPSGTGYALENRMVMSRILPSLFRDSHVHRLSLFFRTLRTTLASMCGRDDHRIVLLTPGPSHETYFEHAYLAKYLGYTLVQGADLTVRDGKVRLKTLDGLQAVDVILRRVDDTFCDPLELRPDSYTGIAGLMQAIRMGNVAVANPLGSSVLENPGLLAFLPGLAKHFLQQDLLLPSPATWWCGQRQARDYVLANLDNLVIKRIADRFGKPSVRGKLLSNVQRELLRQQILFQPHWYVGSEEAPRSTTPVLVDGKLEPRQLILRSFLVSNADGYRVMPGGLTRVSSSSDSLVISSQSGGLSKDTWVLASEPENTLTLIPTTKQPIISFEGLRELPSRVAENLFWLGRYAERAEFTIRLLRSVLIYLTEPYDFPNSQQQNCLETLLRSITYLTETYPGFIGEGGQANLQAPDKELLSIFLNQNRVGSLSFTLQGFLNAARSVRDRLSIDLWRVISSIEGKLQTLQRENLFQLNNAIDELDSLISSLAAFTGLGIESMTHELGWYFLMIGRRIERATQTTNLLRALLSTATEDDTALLESLLQITDSSLTYRRRYRSQVQINALLELILQSEINPRAVGYQLESLQRHIAKLPRHEAPFRSSEERLILEALTLLRLANIEEISQVATGENFRKELTQLLAKINRILPELSDAITNCHFSHAEQPRQLVQFGSAEAEVEAKPA
jgi:uncharacterized circularly permuted ATP-grasp superfamily protein/uncharacterized alpha-E superfamily protein